MSEIAAVALIMGGTSLKAYGDYQAAGAQEKQAEDAQDVAVRNQAIALAVAGRNVEASRRDTREKVRMQQADARKAMAERRLKFGASGTTGGTVFELMAGLSARDEMDRASIEYTGKVQEQNVRFGGQVMAWKYGTQATQYGNRARSIAKMKKLQAMGTMIKGGAAAAMAYGSLKGSGGGEPGSDAVGGFADYFPE